MYESSAIISYLEEFYKEVPLLPSDKKSRALALQRYHETDYIMKIFEESIVLYAIGKKKAQVRQFLCCLGPSLTNYLLVGSS